MPPIEIKSWINGDVLHVLEVDNLKTALIALVKHRADLSEANLSRANLSEANLSEANLSEANLSEANLYGANLSGANLYGANLYGAKTEDLQCLSDLSDAIDLAPLIFAEWRINGIENAQKKFGLYRIAGENRALVAMCPRFVGGYCFVLPRREIWWWNWSCPNPETVPVLWKEPTP